MYIPPSNAESRPEVLHDFMDAHPFATLVTASSDGLFATHLPLVLDRSRGPHGTLQGHVARANPQHKQMLVLPEALVIFSGADAYITPMWYAAKAEHGKVVPTWNYVAVHGYGTITFRDDHTFLRPHLEALTKRHEGKRDEPWLLSDAPEEYIAQLERAIVGFELPISRLEGKWKMSQNRSSADIDGVVRGLAASPDVGDRAVGEIVQAVRPRAT
ncbi:MAG: FMN-binding negative transcriptional regulator [Gemmatimonadaceae bacterium]